MQVIIQTPLPKFHSGGAISHFSDRASLLMVLITSESEHI
jgi:hypothetical protein